MSQPTSETWVVAAYMLPSKAQQNLHTKGSFAQRGAAQLHMSVDRFVQMSPALCAPGTSLHIVHNTNASDQRRGVEYPRFSDAASRVPGRRGGPRLFGPGETSFYGS